MFYGGRDSPPCCLCFHTSYFNGSFKNAKELGLALPDVYRNFMSCSWVCQCSYLPVMWDTQANALPSLRRTIGYLTEGMMLTISWSPPPVKKISLRSVWNKNWFPMKIHFAANCHNISILQWQLLYFQIIDVNNATYRFYWEATLLVILNFEFPSFLRFLKTFPETCERLTFLP